MNTGDIIMVSRDLKDKQTGEPYVWKFLAVVLKPTRKRIMVLRLGTDDEVMIDRLERWDIRVIPEEHWPDGARVLRMRAIMEGRVDGLI